MGLDNYLAANATSGQGHHTEFFKGNSCGRRFAVSDIVEKSDLRGSIPSFHAVAVGK